MAQTLEKTAVSKLGALLREHQEMVTLGREFIRLAVCARVANRIRESRAAERAAEDCIAKIVLLEETLRGEL